MRPPCHRRPPRLTLDSDVTLAYVLLCIFIFVKGQWEDSASYIGPSISIFSDILKVFHILYVLQLLLYNYLLEIENKLQFSSILGPLLFLLYVNDLCNASKKLSLIQYADDTTLSVSGTSMPDIFPNINSEL